MKKIKCLINLRPMWSKYFTQRENIASFSDIEDHIYYTLAQVIRENRQIDFHFIPFNTDTFGMSDIDPAHRLRDSLIECENYFIEYEEKHCDSILNYLRKFDLAICMRLHACVFCWSSGIPTFGIEYADKPGKVSDFFNQHNAGKCIVASDIDFLSVNEFLNENSADT